MEERSKKARYYVETLLDLEIIRNLDLYEDQGVKVSVHTYDVLDISITEIYNRYGNLEAAIEKVDFFAIVVSSIIHDMSKASLRSKSEYLSHSQIMIKRPDYIVDEVDYVLNSLEEKTNYFIKEDIKENIKHIVLSHHGRWGKVQPNTEEAHIVHKADMYSAKFHRINPVDANDILDLLVKGYEFNEISNILSCTSGILKNRMKRSKHELGLRTANQLLEFYKKNGKVPIGDNSFVKRVTDTKKLQKKVDEIGFTKLMLENELMSYMDDERIFE